MVTSIGWCAVRARDCAMRHTAEAVLSLSLPLSPFPSLSPPLSLSLYVRRVACARDGASRRRVVAHTRVYPVN